MQLLNCMRRITSSVLTFKITGRMSLSQYTTIRRGSLNKEDFRIYFRDDKGPVSPFHDIPLKPSGPSNSKLYNMVVEVPRWSNAKMEIATKDPLNPIKQDLKDGKLRYVANCFPYHGYMWNYGALPQTWENPLHVNEAVGCHGDNDPIDALEIGTKVHEMGAVISVKVLGCFCLIDDGETDWKLLVIDVNDPLASKLNDIKDIEKLMPGFLEASKRWFQIYKIPSGKKANTLGFDGALKDAAFANTIIDETHGFWIGLSKKEIQNTTGLALGRTVAVPNSQFVISIPDANKIIESNPPVGPPLKIDSSVDKWHYVDFK